MRLNHLRTRSLLSAGHEDWSQALSRLTSSPKHRSPRLKYSPSRMLALRLRSHTDQQKQKYQHALLRAAWQRNERLPELTLQTMLRKQDPSGKEKISAGVQAIKPKEWEDILRSVATRGWSKEQFEHWAWILLAEDGDSRVRRFISTNTPKPIFLLLLLLRSDEVFREVESLKHLMVYTSIHHYYDAPTFPEQQVEGKSAGPRRGVALDIHHFLIYLRRLVRHVQRTAPRELLTVARYTASYIKCIPHTNEKKRQNPGIWYRWQCLVFNTAMSLFKLPASNRVLLNMDYNWGAQRYLLAMSDNLEKPLIINKASYQAIREVMAGMKKSGDERINARRYAPSWPPYAHDFDGLDAKRLPESDYSRVMKAGILMKEAGYADDNYDIALDILGGVSPESPTIQTRSLAPKPMKTDVEMFNFYSMWAMKVKSTRNSQEAWRVFNEIGYSSDMEPNIQVYQEMFAKLHAGPVDVESGVLPGDGRENFPIHDANYSEYELARLSPPTVGELYNQMLHRGITPTGWCLHHLIENAASLAEGVRYLRDSGMESASVEVLTANRYSSEIIPDATYRTLRRIPRMVFKSFIVLLCRLQPDYRDREKVRPSELSRIHTAIKLVTGRLVPTTVEGQTFRPPWHAILRALARPFIAVAETSPLMNDIESMMMSIELTQVAQKTIGLDTEILLYLCRTVQKAAIAQLDLVQGQQHPQARPLEPRTLIPSADKALFTIRMVFSHVTQLLDPTHEDKAVPEFRHPINPASLHSYMRALAFLEAKETMVDLIRWMIRYREQVDEEANRIGARARTMIAKTFCAFKAFAGPALTPEEEEEMASLMRGAEAADHSWRWPTAEEVDSYVSSDRRGGSQKLQQRMLSKWWSGAASQPALREVGQHHTVT